VSYRPSCLGRLYLLRALSSGLRGGWMGVLSHSEGNPSRGEKPKQILVLQAGGLSGGQLPHTGKPSAKKPQ